MSHDHNHASSGAGTTLILATLLTLGFAAVEAGVGLWAGSLALVADAGHMVNDAAALALAAGAAWLARRQTSPRHSYGLGRAEFIAALINSLGLAGAGGLADDLRRRASAGAADGHGRSGFDHRRHRPGDQSAGGLAADARGWMEGAPLNLDPEAVGHALAGVPGVLSVHDLHIWTVKADEPLLSAHLVVREIGHWEGVMEASHALLAERFDIHHATLQPEPMTRTVHWPESQGHEYEHERAHR